MANGAIDGEVVARSQKRDNRKFRATFNYYQNNNTYVQKKGYYVAPATIFTVIFVLLFVTNFFYATVGYEQTFTFSHLLEKFSTIEPVGIDWIRDFADMRIEEDWSVFNWFRDFLNNFVMKIVTAFLFLCTGLVELVRYAYFFVGILFGW